MNAVGAPQSVLVLGGSSDIASAAVRALPVATLRRVVLAGRPSPALDEAAADLSAAGIAGVETTAFDATDTASHGAFVDRVFADGDIDVVLLAFGVLGSQSEAEADPSAAVAVATTNYTGAVSVGLHVARHLRDQGHGVLVVLSSVAGDRARRSNFVYGSTKAGLTAFAEGLGHALQGSGARVLVVRPGFVRTRMTTGMPDGPMAVEPDVVGSAIAKGIRTGKETIYVPGPLRAVMAVAKAMPTFAFRKLPV